MKKRKPSIRAMFLRYHYRHTFFHCLETIKAHDEYGQWWTDMDTFDRAYVLKGKHARRKRRKK